MDIFINETQEKKLKEFLILKKILFKYWDKFGPSADYNILRYLGGTNYNFINKQLGSITMDDIKYFLYEWLGEEVAINKTKEFLKINEFTIDDCGGYDFKFKITKIHPNNENEILVDLIVDDINGKVALIMTDGEVKNLSDAINNEDYGWEVNNEIEDCIWEFFNNKITYKTGVTIKIDNFELTSSKK